MAIAVEWSVQVRNVSALKTIFLVVNFEKFDSTKFTFWNIHYNMMYFNYKRKAIPGNIPDLPPSIPFLMAIAVEWSVQVRNVSALKINFVVVNFEKFYSTKLTFWNIYNIIICCFLIIKERQFQVTFLTCHPLFHS